MKHKTTKRLWAVIAVIGIIAMISFSILPIFQ